MEKPFALIIEDDRDIAALFRHVLDIAGYHTETALHGKQAIKRLESTRPDIVLLDLHLPGIPGEQILKQMRSDERLKSVPVVVVTAHSEIADNLPAEADLVLLKPVNLDQLSVLVQRLRTTSESMHEPPWDSITRLYNRSFFMVRLTYSLERLRQITASYFGVLFVDMDPFASLQARLSAEQLKAFMRETAARLKTVLRPTDTTAHFGEGLFLILIEEVSALNVPSKVARRVQLELGNYLSQAEGGAGLQVYVGGVLCDGGYSNAEEILGDVEIARKLTRNNQEYVFYNRAMLMGRRAAAQDS